VSICRPATSLLTTAGLAAGATTSPVVIRGDAEGDVEGLPTPGLALGLPLVDGEPELPTPTPLVAPASPADGEPAAPALAPEPSPLADAPLPPDDPLLPLPPLPEALPPEPLPLPPPRASAIPTASGPIASAIASSRENIPIIAFIEILLRDCALGAHELWGPPWSNGYAS
jgi:hypothetical protein